jgi:hypothetical protein
MAGLSPSASSCRSGKIAEDILVQGEPTGASGEPFRPWDVDSGPFTDRDVFLQGARKKLSGGVEFAILHSVFSAFV